MNYDFKKLPELLFTLGLAAFGTVWLTIQDWDWETVKEDPEAAIAVVAVAAGRAVFAAVVPLIGKLLGGGSG